MNEIVPGVFHWKAKHPNIGAEVSCYYLSAERVLIDPMEPEEGLDWFREQRRRPSTSCCRTATTTATARSSSRRSAARCTRAVPGMHEFSDDQQVEPFDFGDELPGGVKAYEAGAICPDDTAFHIPAHSALSVADGVINYGGLGFVPEEHLGDDVDATKRAIRESYAKLAAELEFDNLLVAHGEPVVGGASEQLREFADG